MSGDKNLVRITFDRLSGFKDLQVEYGKVFYRELTPEEKEEMKTLEEHLANFKDFQTAEKLQDDQHKAVLEKKRRLEELKQLPTEPQLEWEMADPQLIDSVFLLIRPQFLTEYAENIPQFLLDRMMKDEEQVVNININSTAAAPAPKKKEEAEKPLAKNRVEAELYKIQDKLSEDWESLVTVDVRKGENERYEGKDTYWIKPITWLQEDYKPIDDMVKGELGGLWQSKGKGDKDAHWEILV